MLPTNPLLNATAPAGPHLPTATLRQYAAGTLAPAACHRVEAHTLACPRCADVLEGLLQTPAATTDQTLTQLQQRLRHRVQQAESARAATSRTRPGHRWVVPQLAAAATLLFGLVAGGWWTWQQRHPASPTGAVPAAQRLARASPPLALPAAAVASAPPMALPAAPDARPSRLGKKRPLAHQHHAARAALATKPGSHPATTPPAGPAAAASSEAPAFTGQPAPATAPASPDSASRSGQADALDAVRVRSSAMPAGPRIAPVPVGGYAAWRERLRQAASEFRPADPAQPLSGVVQLRVTVGADGKILQTKVLHGLRADYDDEAQRLVRDGPAWVPGIGGGKRAAQPVNVTVPFE